MKKDSPTWGTLLKQTDGVPTDLLTWWLSDYLDQGLTTLPLQQEPTVREYQDFEQAAERLRQGEPVQYVSARAPFRHLQLAVSPAVLIPRPETEQLVQWVLDTGVPPGQSVLDVGTGSGCIALSLKYERPDLRVTGLDVSPDALQVAKTNAETNGLDVSLYQSDLLADVPDGSMDLIIANLPYIGEEERDLLPDMVRDWEPPLALFSGKDGTPLIQRLLEQAPRVLRSGGQVFLETGETHTPFLEHLSQTTGWTLESRKDLAGRERFHRLTQTG